MLPVHLVDEHGNLGGVGLEVVVHAEDQVSVGVVETAHDAVVLAEVPHERDAVDRRVLLGEATDLGVGVIGRAVVHQEEIALVAGEARELVRHHLHDAADRVLGTVTGNDDGDEHAKPLYLKSGAEGVDHDATDDEGERKELLCVHALMEDGDAEERDP